jgi:large subunit ribosomal protein L23
MDHPQYTFKVDIKSNKYEIKKAIEEAFGVKVSDVNTIRYLGKKKRVRIKEGKRPDWKKAIITLAEGQKIEIV